TLRCELDHQRQISRGWAVSLRAADAMSAAISWTAPTPPPDIAVLIRAASEAGLPRFARNYTLTPNRARPITTRGNAMLTLHHLHDSRPQRILWLMEELALPHEIKRYQRNAETRLAPPELTSIHPLGKSPVITDGGTTIAESGAIVDYIIRRYGKGAMMPAPGSADYEAYNEWLHYSEGSAMLPLMLNLYVSRLKEAGAP